MYFEARGAASRPVVIASAVSSDMLVWRVEEGIRLEYPTSVHAPRFTPAPGGGGGGRMLAIGQGTSGPQVRACRGRWPVAAAAACAGVVEVATATWAWRQGSLAPVLSGDGHC